MTEDDAMQRVEELEAEKAAIVNTYHEREIEAIRKKYPTCRSEIPVSPYWISVSHYDTELKFEGVIEGVVLRLSFRLTKRNGWRGIYISARHEHHRNGDLKRISDRRLVAPAGFAGTLYGRGSDKDLGHAIVYRDPHDIVLPSDFVEGLKKV